MTPAEPPDPTPRPETRERRLVRALGAASRKIQGHGPLSREVGGVTKRVASLFFDRGIETYRDPWGHLVEADLSDYMERAGFFGAHSPGLLRRLPELVRPGDWVIDVGANVGLVTSQLCAQVGPTGCVWAVEPLPANVVKLEQFKHSNQLDHLTILPLALSSESTTARLRIPITGGSGWGSFVATWETQGDVEVETCPLDDLVASSNVTAPLRLVKIDAEGSEPQVLVGAAETLKTMRPLVLCEFNDILLHQAGTSSEELLQAFARLGFSPIGPGSPPTRQSMKGKTVDLLLSPERPVEHPA